MNADRGEAWPYWGPDLIDELRGVLGMPPSHTGSGRGDDWAEALDVVRDLLAVPERFDPADERTWPPQAFMDGDRVLVWEETGVTPGRWREAWFLDADPEGDYDPGGPRFIDNEISLLADGPTWWMPMPPAPGGVS